MENTTKKINQESAYKFLLTNEFKNWFLDRFDGGKPSQPYQQFMHNFSRFLELKGCDQKFHFKIGKTMHSLQVSSTCGKIILTLNEGQQISGYAPCPVIPPITIFS